MSKLVGQPERSVRFRLAALEQAGLILRIGERGGWLAVDLADPG